MNKSRSLIDIFIIYAIEILCNINVDIIININIKIVLDIAVIQISYNFFYRTSILYIKFLFISITLQDFLKSIYKIFSNLFTRFSQIYYNSIYHTFYLFSSSLLIFSLVLFPLSSAFPYHLVLLIVLSSLARHHKFHHTA